MLIQGKDMTPEEAMQGCGFKQKSMYWDAWRYIWPALVSKLLRLKTPWRDVERIYELISVYCATVAESPEELMRDLAGLEKKWPAMEAALRKNRGMARLMLDHGWCSRIIMPYILAGAQAISLDVFYGRAFDLQDRFVELPPGDMSRYYSVWEPIGVFIRERIQWAQQELMRPGLTAAFCGAGLMPELRLFGYDLAKWQPKVLACDMDERVLDGLKLVFDRPVHELGIQYQLASIHDMANYPANYEVADVTLAQGIPSYYRSEKATMELFTDLARITKPGGKIFFDLQVFEMTLVRCALGMGWESDLTPDWTPKTAIKRMQKMASKLNLDLEYRVDSRNRHPVGVMFMATKRKD